MVNQHLTLLQREMIAAPVGSGPGLRELAGTLARATIHCSSRNGSTILLNQPSPCKTLFGIAGYRFAACRADSTCVDLRFHVYPLRCGLVDDLALWQGLL